MKAKNSGHFWQTARLSLILRTYTLSRFIQIIIAKFEMRRLPITLYYKNKIETAATAGLTVIKL